MDLFENELIGGQSFTLRNCLVAIDPGTNGSIVFMVNNTVQSIKMPDTPKDLFDCLKQLADRYDCVVYMEKVQGLPGMGGSPMFNFGKGYGYLEMALIALELRTVTVTPQKWQKFIAIGTKGKSTTTEWKNKLKAKAQQLYPSHKVVLWNADSLLILEYAKSIEK